MVVDKIDLFGPTSPVEQAHTLLLRQTSQVSSDEILK